MVEFEVAYRYGEDGEDREFGVEDDELDLVVVTDEYGERPYREYVPKEKYDELKKDAEMYYALRAAGVDNWDGYGYAMEILEEWAEEDE